jgi:MFS transporter, SP family, arabinose:H+ symporter
MALNRVLIRSAAAAALGGLLFGFDTAVIAGTTHALTERFALSPFMLGFGVSIALWGTVAGALSAGEVGERIGSRAALRVMALLYVFSALGCAFALNWTGLLVARFIGGLGIGGSSVLGPVYIAEVAPPSYRGRMVGLFQINIVVGIVLAYISNFIVVSFQLGAAEWRWEFGVAAVPAALFFFMLLGIPHSPRWLAAKGRHEEARATLALIGDPDPDSELKTIIASTQVKSGSQKERLFQRAYLRPILLALAVAAFNQLSGINAVLYYTNDIFAWAGFSRVSGGLQAIAVGAVNLVFTLVAMALIDKLGRKTLLLLGSAGMAIALGVVATIYSTGHGQRELIYFVAAFIAFFAVSSGAVIWVYVSEIFPNRVRMKGQALGSTVIWVLNGLISQIFPVMAARSVSFPFCCFAGLMALQFIVVLTLFPETKGLSLEELQRKLQPARNAATRSIR